MAIKDGLEHLSFPLIGLIISKRDVHIVRQKALCQQIKAKRYGQCSLSSSTMSNQQLKYFLHFYSPKICWHSIQSKISKILKICNFSHNAIFYKLHFLKKIIVIVSRCKKLLRQVNIFQGNSNSFITSIIYIKNTSVAEDLTQLIHMSMQSQQMISKTDKHDSSGKFLKISRKVFPFFIEFYECH